MDIPTVLPALPVVLHPETAFPTPCHDGFAGLTLAERAARAETLHRAYSIWESKGRPENQQLADWHEAESEMREEALLTVVR